ncbi:MAG: hypothetical protein U9Q69_03265 [Nanoarchaeota archaeon]|nr:hypothetical protein [Nanoarchaeota archaeon]
MGALYLIGTYHHDKDKGPEKLKKLYRAIRPDIVLSETEATTYTGVGQLIIQFQTELMKHTTDFSGVEDFILNYQKSIGFEIPFNIEYAKANNIPLHMIDSPNAQRKAYRSLEKNIAGLTARAREQSHVDIRSWLESYNSCPEFDESVPNEFWKEIESFEGTALGELILFLVRLKTKSSKDSYMESQIRRLYDPEKVIAFPVGMIHIAESKTRQTLYSKVKDLNPERIPLI